MDAELDFKGLFQVAQRGMELFSAAVETPQVVERECAKALARLGCVQRPVFACRAAERELVAMLLSLLIPTFNYMPVRTFALRSSSEESLKLPACSAIIPAVL